MEVILYLIISFIIGYFIGYYIIGNNKQSVNGNCNQIIKNCNNSKITQISSNKTIDIDI